MSIIKGQLISKGLFGFFNSSKKTNEKFLLQQARAKIKNFKFIFGSTEDIKISFRDKLTFKTFLVLTYEDNFATLIFEVAKALFCHEVAELACPQKSFLCKGIAKGCDALQSFDGFFTLTGCIAQNHSQVRSPISPICIGTFLEKQKTSLNYLSLLHNLPYDCTLKVLIDFCPVLPVLLLKLLTFYQK